MTHRMKFWLLAALAVGSSLIAGTIIGKTVPLSGGVDNPELVLPALLAVASLVMFACWLWWRKTDDLQKQGQMLSWWWGGNIGALVMAVCLATLTGRHSDLTHGAFYMFFAQFAGFVLVWLAWKLRGMGPTE